MNVLNKMGRKILFVSLGVVMAAGVAIFGPTAPANACYNGNGCDGGGYNSHDDYWRVRCDGPNGCENVEYFKLGWVYQLVDNCWALNDPNSPWFRPQPGDIWPGGGNRYYGYGNGSGNLVNVGVGPGGVFVGVG